MTTDEFPTLLSRTPRESRIDETFGWTPAALALGGLIVGAGYLIDGLSAGFSRSYHLEILAGGFAVAVVMSAFELYRRRRRLSLSLQHGALGLYRRESLLQVIQLGQVTEYRLHIVNTIRELIMFGVASLFCVPFAFFFEGLAQLWAIAGAIAAVTAFVSSIWIRAMCKHYIIPVGKAEETVVLTNRQLASPAVMYFRARPGAV